jgi:hypothetical protein
MPADFQFEPGDGRKKDILGYRRWMVVGSRDIDDMIIIST